MKRRQGTATGRTDRGGETWRGMRELLPVEDDGPGGSYWGGELSAASRDGISTKGVCCALKRG